MRIAICGLFLFVISTIAASPGLAQDYYDRPPANSSNQAYSVEGGSSFSYTTQAGSSNSSVEFFAFGNPGERRQTITEDVAILDHLISKSLPRQAPNMALGVSINPRFGQKRAIYVGGSGLILTYNVAYPVADITKDVAEEQAEEPKVSSEWELAKSAIRSKVELPDGFVRVTVNQLTGLKVPYDKNQVAELDSAVRRGLAQVGNFRDLDGNDSVTVYVHGLSVRTGDTMTNTVMAWRVRMDDVQSDGSVPRNAIESVQYTETGNSIGNVTGFDFRTNND